MRVKFKYRGDGLRAFECRCGPVEPHAHSTRTGTTWTIRGRLFVGAHAGVWVANEAECDWWRDDYGGGEAARRAQTEGVGMDEV